MEGSRCSERFGPYNNKARHYVVWVSVEAIKWLTEEYNSCSETVVTVDDSGNQSYLLAAWQRHTHYGLHTPMYGILTSLEHYLDGLMVCYSTVTSFFAIPLCSKDSIVEL